MKTPQPPTMVLIKQGSGIISFATASKFAQTLIIASVETANKVGKILKLYHHQGVLKNTRGI